MEELLFNCYLKFKKEHSSDLWEKINMFPKYLIVLFITSILSALVTLFVIFIFHNPLWAWILIAIELISTIALGFCTEKYSVDNSRTQIDNYINYCKDMYHFLYENHIKTEENVREILNRINKMIANMQIKLDKNYDGINKLMQVLFIPIILAILKSFFDSSSDFSGMVGFSVVIMVFTLIAYSLIIGGIKLMYYDDIRYQNKLKYFANDLQGVIDVMATFSISDDMKNVLISHNHMNNDNINIKENINNQEASNIL